MNGSMPFDRKPFGRQAFCLYDVPKFDTFVILSFGQQVYFIFNNT
jgi:hypothetical protein